MKSQYKKLSAEDKFARRFYCNAYRFVGKMKRLTTRVARRKLKKLAKDGE